MSAAADAFLPGDARRHAERARTDQGKWPPYEAQDDRVAPAAPVSMPDAAAIASLVDHPGKPCAERTDVLAFERTLAASSPKTAVIDRLTTELAEFAELGRLGACDSCAFELDLPGLGRMEGWVTIRRGHADLELQALRPSTAAALRARRHELQRRLDQASGGEVSLSIL